MKVLHVKAVDAKIRELVRYCFENPLRERIVVVALLIMVSGAVAFTAQRASEPTPAPPHPISREEGLTRVAALGIRFMNGIIVSVDKDGLILSSATSTVIRFTSDTIIYMRGTGDDPAAQKEILVSELQTGMYADVRMSPEYFDQALMIYVLPKPTQETGGSKAPTNPFTPPRL